MAEFPTLEAFPAIPVPQQIALSCFFEEDLFRRLIPALNANYCHDTDNGYVLVEPDKNSSWVVEYIRTIVPAVRDFAKRYREDILKLAPIPSEYADKPLREQQARFNAVIVEKILARGYGWKRRMKPVTDAFPNMQWDEWFSLVCVHLWNENHRILIEEPPLEQDEVGMRHTATIRKLRSLLPDDTIKMLDDGTNPKETPDRDLIRVVLAIIRMVQVLPETDIDDWYSEAIVELGKLKDL